MKNSSRHRGPRCLCHTHSRKRRRAHACPSTRVPSLCPLPLRPLGSCAVFTARRARGRSGRLPVLALSVPGLNVVFTSRHGSNELMCQGYFGYSRFYEGLCISVFCVCLCGRKRECGVVYDGELYISFFTFFSDNGDVHFFL